MDTSILRKFLGERGVESRASRMCIPVDFSTEWLIHSVEEAFHHVSGGEAWIERSQSEGLIVKIDGCGDISYIRLMGAEKAAIRLPGDTFFARFASGELRTGEVDLILVDSTGRMYVGLEPTNSTRERLEKLTRELEAAKARVERLEQEAAELEAALARE